MTQYIKIHSTPAGEAPEEIRDCWVGLTLPILDIGEPQPITFETTGVLSTPGPLKSFVLRLFNTPVKTERVTGYVVDGFVALAVLNQEHPSAARWWKKNAPHVNKQGSSLVFHDWCCKLSAE